MNIITAIAALVVKELFRRKDFYVVFVLTALITLVMGSVNFFNDAKIARYLKEIVLLLIWIASLVIALATTARQIPSERENRTIFPLLAKPVTRSQVIFGKFLGSWIACGAALAIFYIFFLIISGTREPHWQVGIGFQAFWLHWMMLGIVVAMTMFGSIIFAAPSSNTTIVFVLCAGILLIGRHLNKVAVQMLSRCAPPFKQSISPCPTSNSSTCATS